MLVRFPKPASRSAHAKRRRLLDPNQIQVRLGFNAEYNGNVHLYAVDWDGTTRRETISVNGQTAVLGSSFHEGAWVTIPVHVQAGERVTITVDRTAGPNAVLSGIFLGEGGVPPGPTVETAPQGSWTGVVGSAGYDLGAWGGSAEDVANLPASVSLVQGARYQWTAGTSGHACAQRSHRHDAHRRDLLRP